MYMLILNWHSKVRLLGPGISFVRLIFLRESVKFLGKTTTNFVLLHIRELDLRCWIVKAKKYQGTEATSKYYFFYMYCISLGPLHCLPLSRIHVSFFFPVRYFGAAKDLPGVRELFEQEREYNISI